MKRLAFRTRAFGVPAMPGADDTRVPPSQGPAGTRKEKQNASRFQTFPLQDVEVEWPLREGDYCSGRSGLWC